MRKLKILITVAVGVCYSSSVLAEHTFAIYSGVQSAPHANVKGTDSDGNSFDFTAGWVGKSFDAPPYYGFRWTAWDGDAGWGVDFTHSKIYADTETLADNGFKVLEMTDGLNNLLVHRTQRYASSLSSGSHWFAGLGVGIALPHVEVQTTRDSAFTHGYQYGGPSLGYNLGWRKEPTDSSIGYFTEFKFTSSWLDVGLKNNGSLKTRVFTNALNVGVLF